MSRIGSGLRATGRGAGRGLGLTGRGLASAGRGVGRGSAAVLWRPLATAWRSGHRDLVLTGVLVLTAISVWGIGFGTSETVYDVERTGWGPMPLVGVLIALPVLTLLTRPMVGLLVSVGGAFALAISLPLVEPRFPWSFEVIHGLVIFALLFATCARENWQRALGAWLVTAALFGWGVQPDLRAGWIVGVSIIAVVGVLVGRLTATRRALADQRQVSAEEKAARVVLQERARIARDLHDIVAHHMSLVVVQAETAEYRVADLPEAAKAELLQISETARSALTETRALLTVLRQDDAALHTPQPGVDQLPDLVDAARRAGVTLTSELPGVTELAPRLGPGVSMAGYRIVQEALSNASRHAPGAPVRLSGVQDGATLRLRVTNGPNGGAAPGPEGHGITGMRERAAAAGGALRVGPTGDGGFDVEVALPLPS